MNVLPLEKKILVLSALVEGNSICSIVRMTGVNKRTILRILCEAGEKAQEIHDREMVNLRVGRMQLDERGCILSGKSLYLYRSS